MLKGSQALMHAIESGSPEPTNEAQRKELSAEWQRTGSAETLAKLEAVEAKHTPGPWRAHCGQNSIDIQPDIAKVYIQAGRYDGSQSKQRTANANLIAAAPELLEACKSAEWLIQQLVTMNRIPANNEALRLARAAIAKAGGAT